MNIWNRLKFGLMATVSSVLPMKALAQSNADAQNEAVRNEWKARVNNQKDTTIFSILSRDYHKIGVPNADSLAATAANKFAYLRDSVSEEEAAFYLERVYSPIANRLSHDSTMIVLRNVRTDTEETKALKAAARTAENESYASYKHAEKVRLAHREKSKKEHMDYDALREQARQDNGATYVTPKFIASDTLEALDHAHSKAEAKRQAEREATEKKTMKAWTASQKDALANALAVKSALEAQLVRHDELDEIIRKCDADLAKLSYNDLNDRAMSGDRKKDRKQVKDNKKNLSENDKNSDAAKKICKARKAAVDEQKSMPTRDQIRERLRNIEKEISELETTLKKIKKKEITIVPGTELIPFEDSELAEKAGLKGGKGKNGKSAQPAQSIPTPTKAAPTNTPSAKTSRNGSDNVMITAPRASTPAKAPRPVNRDAEIAAAVNEVKGNAQKVDAHLYLSGATRDDYLEADGSYSYVMMYPASHRNKAAIMRGNVTTVYSAQGGDKTIYSISGNDLIVVAYNGKNEITDQRKMTGRGSAEEIFKAIGWLEAGALDKEVDHDIAQVKTGYQKSIDEFVKNIRTTRSC